MHVLARLAFVLGGLLIPLLVLELAFRLWGPILPGNYRTGLLLRPHPVYGTFHKPGNSMWIQDPEFTTYVRFNSDGLRGPEIAREKPPGVARVLILGDSFIAGNHVSEEQTVASRLQGLLEPEHERSVEVINGGVPGWSPSEEYLFLRHQGLGFQPDLVVVAIFVGNDIEPNTHTSKTEQGIPDRPAFSVNSKGALKALPWSSRPRGAGDLIADALRDQLVVFRVFESGVLEKRDARSQAQQRDAKPQERETHPRPLKMLQSRERPAQTQAWRVLEALLRAMQREAGQSGVRTLLAIVPTIAQVERDNWEGNQRRWDIKDGEDGWDRDGPNTRLVEIAQRIGLPVVDLTPTLRAAAADGERMYFPRNVHWTAAGHAVAARAIYDYVRVNSLLP